MEQPMRAGVRAIVLAVTALFLIPLQAQAERNWEFSVGVFGGKAFHSNEDMRISVNDPFDPPPWWGTVHGVTLNDSGTFGGKVSAWYLPRRYNWQPQVGFEIDFTRFTADRHPQLRGLTGQ